MNTENSKTNESNKLIYQFTDNLKLNLKTQNNKSIRIVNLSIYYTWKNIKSAYNNHRFNLVVLIQSQKFRITLNLSSENTKL